MVLDDLPRLCKQRAYLGLGGVCWWLVVLGLGALACVREDEVLEQRE